MRIFAVGPIRVTRKIILQTAIFSIALAYGSATAQSYPARPVRLIVPFPAGGGNDTIARTVGGKLGAMLGQQFVIDNRPGAGGSLGAELAARALPDGYTLFLGGVGSHAINPSLHAKLGYDPIRDFAPISLIAESPMVVVVTLSLPVKSVKELIALAKSRPGEINFASLGIGSSTHLAVELFMTMTGADMAHIPYNQSPPLTFLIAGQVQVMFSSAVRMLPQVRAGRLRAIAVTGATRSQAMPEIPTVAESGVPGYETSSWYGILAPAKTPQAIITALSTDIARIVNMPDVNKQLIAEASDPVGGSPAEFTAKIKHEIARWRDVVRRSGLRVD
jgi:tripartite-type tricarboxylate transporter receptor subunit TctC